MCVSSLKITTPELMKAWNSFDSAWNPHTDPQAQDHAPKSVFEMVKFSILNRKFSGV